MFSEVKFNDPLVALPLTNFVLLVTKRSVAGLSEKRDTFCNIKSCLNHVDACTGGGA